MSRSLYRKYRPETFSEVVGQDHVEKTLMSAVTTGTVSHAYLFAGPSGTGKTTTARLLAKALLCEQAPTDHPDGSCARCRAIADGIHPDVYELDAASRTGVENVRDEIISRVQFAPTQGSYKIYIIDEVHMLSTAAFNALLKTLEEPPPHVIFVLCTTDAHKVIETIRARCQRFDFHRLSNEQIVARLSYICEQEGFAAEASALELIAARASGKMRDAISSLEQVAVYSGGNLSNEAVESMLGEVIDDQLFALGKVLAENDAAGAFGWIADFVQAGTDIALLVSDFARHMRNVYITALTLQDEPLLELFDINIATLSRYREQVLEFGSSERIAFVLTVLGDLSVELKSAPNARLAMEIACTRIVSPSSELSLAALAARLAELEHRLMSGVLATIDQTMAAPAVTTSAQTQPSQPPVQQIKAQPEASATETNQRQAVATEPTKTTAAADPLAPTASPIANINQLWHQVESDVRQQKISVGMMLDGSQAAIAADGTTLVVTLPSGAGFAQKTLQSPENVTMITGALNKLSGAAYTIRYVLGGEGANTEAKAASATADVAVPQAASEETRSKDEPDDNIATPETAAETTEETNNVSTAPSSDEIQDILSLSFGSEIKLEVESH